MRTNLSLKQRIAIEIERKTCGSAEHWDDEQLHAWCFDDQFGAKYFVDSIRLADHIMKKFDVKERKDDTPNHSTGSERATSPVQS